MLKFNSYIADESDTDAENNKIRRPLSRWDHMTIGLAEFIGTATLLFLSCLGCTMHIQGDISSMHVGLCAGLAVLAVIQMFGHVSGAHVNPAVTLSAFILDEITAIQVPIYIISQVLGCIAGYGLQRLVTPDAITASPGGRGICINHPHEAMTDWEALAVETVLTFILVTSICASWDKNNSNKMDSVAIRIGLVVGVLNLAASAYTGASMNPVRSFGPAFWLNDYESHWVYWVGPTFGSVIATVTYKNIFTIKLY